MAITQQHYGDLAEADAYFANRLHEVAWSTSSNTDRTKALIAATSIIDALNFKCDKSASTQVLEFPRGTDTTVPEAVRRACYEIAHSLLDGKDPELELENLSAISQTFGQVRTGYDRESGPLEHLVNGVPSAIAWRLLRPFLRDGQSVRLRRSS